MIDKIKKGADLFFIFLGFTVLIALALFGIFIENPVRYFGYALLITAVLNYKKFWILKTDFKKTAKAFCINLSIVYLSLITLLSVSPLLDIQEFKLSHRKWEMADAKIIKYSSSWDNGYRRRGNSYVDLYYEYKAGGKLYKNSEHGALKKYYPIWNTEKSENLVAEFSKSVSEKIRSRDYIVFTDPDKNQSSKLFLSTGLFYFQGSLFYNMITGIAAMILILLGIFAAVFILPVKRQGIKK